MQVETLCHIACADYLRQRENQTKRFFYVHVPNGAKRGVRQSATLKRMGMRAGFPDFQIFFRDFSHSDDGFGVIFIELKREDVNYRKNQKEVREKLEAQGFINHHLIQTDSPIEAVKELKKILELYVGQYD